MLLHKELDQLKQVILFNNIYNKLIEKEEIKMDIEEEEDEEAALEKARLLSIQEHEDMLKKKDEEESKKYFINMKDLNFKKFKKF